MYPLPSLIKNTASYEYLNTSGTVTDLILILLVCSKVIVGYLVVLHSIYANLKWNLVDIDIGLHFYLPVSLFVS